MSDPTIDPRAFDLAMNAVLDIPDRYTTGSHYNAIVAYLYVLDQIEDGRYDYPTQDAVNDAVKRVRAVERQSRG